MSCRGMVEEDRKGEPLGPLRCPPPQSMRKFPRSLTGVETWDALSIAWAGEFHSGQ